MKQKSITQLLTGFGLMVAMSGCASISQPSRVVLDSNYEDGRQPKWVKSNKVSWEEGEDLLIRSSYTIRGDQSLGACYDLSRASLKENLLAELAADIKAELNIAGESLNEASDPVVNRVFRQTVQGRMAGLRLKEQVYERYIVTDAERVDCHVLAGMRKRDYRDLKLQLTRKLSSVSDEVRAAINQRNVRFFEDEQDSAPKQVQERGQ